MLDLVPMPRRSRPDARSAYTGRTLHTGVFGGVFVPILAVGSVSPSSAGVSLRNRATSPILPIEDRFMVAWTNTQSNTAKVIDRVNAWLYTSLQFVSKTVGKVKQAVPLYSADVNMAVALSVLGRSPYPTVAKVRGIFGYRPVLVHFWPIAVGKWSNAAYSRHLNIVSGDDE